MKVLVIKKVPSTIYPKLMYSTKTQAIVLFTGNEVGTLVSVGSSTNSLGEVCTCWSPTDFEYLPADVEATLSN